jgi:hypothetical protein
VPVQVHGGWLLSGLHVVLPGEWLEVLVSRCLASEEHGEERVRA